jgi:hypothetical protein
MKYADVKEFILLADKCPLKLKQLPDFKTVHGL